MPYDVGNAKTRHEHSPTLRDLIDQKHPVFGGWCSIPAAFSVEIAAASGCDWVCIDMQHGLIGYEQMANMVQGAFGWQVPAVVRVPWNDPSSIMKALDAGADGVIVPMVNNREQAEAAVAACRYPPDGYRSWGPIRASMVRPGYDPVTANRSTVLLVMIETPEALRNLTSILETPGVDGVYIGPWDLSLATTLALETPGRKPADIEAISEVLNTCQKLDLASGIACTDETDAHRWIELGATLLAVSGDAAVLGAGIRQTLQRARRAAEDEA